MYYKASLVIAFVFAVLFSINLVSAQEGLIGHWKFDGNGNNEISGGAAAVTVGSASFKPDGGKLGGYLYIPTGSDSAKIPYSSTFDLPDSFAVEFWFRQRSDQAFNQDLVYKGSGTNNYNFKIFRYLWNQYNSGAVIAGHTAANTGSWTQASNSNTPPHNEWHHVVYTKSSAEQAYYIDGALIHSKSFTQYPEYGGPAKTPANDIIIGDTAVDTDIDNLKIYNKALTLSEVASSGGFTAPICTPNSNRCSGNNVEQCNSAGSAWINPQSCGYGTCDTATNSCKYPSTTPLPANLCNSTSSFVGCGNQTSCSAASGNWCGTVCQKNSCGQSVSPTPASANVSQTPVSTSTPLTNYTSDYEGEKKICSAGRGKWVTFPNGCGDSCRKITIEDLACTQAFQDSCDCGSDKCWDGDSKECVDNSVACPHPSVLCSLNSKPVEKGTNSRGCPEYKCIASNACNTDQDCAWLVENGCPENAGASWGCNSLLESSTADSPKTKTCPKILSIRPTANCGCIENTCLAYLDKKPKDPVRKIGNVTIDAGVLLSGVIQMEQLKVKFEFLKSATSKLSSYYNSTGDSKSASRWASASDILQSGIDKIEALKTNIRDKIDTFSVEDMKQLKNDLKFVRSILKDVLKAVLG